MSTYYNEQRKRYENFQKAVVDKVTQIAASLESTSGEGITVVAGVRYDTAQTLTDAQQAQARTNIGAVGTTELDAASDIVGELNRLVDYGQNDYPVDTATQKRNGLRITINNSFQSSNNAAWMKFSNNYTWADTNPKIAALTNPLFLQEGHRYRLAAHYVSGTYERTGGGAPIVAIACVAGTSASIPGVVFGGDTDSHVEFDCTGDAYTAGVHLCIGIRRTQSVSVTLTNYTFDLTLEDITDSGMQSAVSGTTPTIVAVPGVRYECGTVTELTFTPSASGLCEVVFASGSTATVLTLPSTVRMPDWWTGVEANRTYDIMILNGTLAGVMSWAT